MQPTEISEGSVTFKAQQIITIKSTRWRTWRFAATVLDSVTGCAVHTMLPAGVGYGTIDLNVKMCRPIPQKSGFNCHRQSY